jgi:hypothetical protein
MKLPLTLALLLLLLPSTATAFKLKLDVRKKYEEELIRWALDQTGLKREENPGGKVIERVVIVREDIIAESDPWPNFFNWFHVKTRDYVVRQEVLVQPGETWDEEKVAESARNLRGLFVLAVVRAVPCRSDKPGQVVLLVVTKDLWSIRVNTRFSQVGTVLQQLSFTPTEHNFLGRNKSISLFFDMWQLDWETRSIRNRFAVGQRYIDPRVMGTRLRFEEWFDLLMAGDVPCGGARGAQTGVWCPERGLGDVEGAFAQLRLRRPLFSLDTPWAFDSWVQVNVKQVRLYRVNSTSVIPRGEIAGLSLRADTYQQHSERPAVPRVYDSRVVSGRATYTRSYGRDTKYNAAGSVGFYTQSYRHPDNMPFDDEVLRWHAANYLPRSEDGVYVSISGQTHARRFIRLHNIQGFALSEDFALGHNVSVELRFTADLDNAAHSHFSAGGQAGYNWYFARDLLSVWLAASSRLQPNQRDMDLGERDYEGPWANTFFEAAIRNVSPPILWGRLHARAMVALHHNNLDRTRVFLGGDAQLDTTLTGFRMYRPALRGYPGAHFEGDGLLALNAEYRSKPLNIFTLHLGFVVFYDGGGVFGGPDPLQPGRDLELSYHHSVGAGIRGHFPQFDKQSLRADFAVPLTSARGAPSTWFSLSFTQVF